jgi:probable addiction module antidote protein
VGGVFGSGDGKAIEKEASQKEVCQEEARQRAGTGFSVEPSNFRPATKLEERQMALKTFPFDAAEYLEDDEAIVEYLEEAMKIATEDSDPSFLTVALGTVARARGMSQIAKDAGLSRESLYKALGSAGNPEFGTVLKVLQALGLKLSIQSQGTAA